MSGEMTNPATPMLLLLHWPALAAAALVSMHCDTPATQTAAEVCL
jgi:hypothetical protein